MNIVGALLLLASAAFAQVTVDTFELRLAHPVLYTLPRPLEEPLEFAPGSRVTVSPLLTAGFFGGKTRCYDWNSVSVLVYPIGSLEGFHIPITTSLSPGAKCATPLGVIPSAVPPGLAEVLFIDENGLPYRPALLRIVPSRFGLYTANLDTYEAPARAFRTSAGAPPQPLQLTRPARPGDTILLEGTGIGESAASAITIEVAGVPIRASSVTTTPDGLDQIRFTMPSDARLNGCYLAVRVLAGDQQSNIGSLPVAPGTSACDHPLKLNVTQMADLDTGRSIAIGELSIRTFTTPSLPSGFRHVDSAGATFRSYDALSVAVLSGLQRRDDELFDCRTEPYSPVAFFAGGSGLKAGDTLTLGWPRQYGHPYRKQRFLHRRTRRHL